MRAFLSIKYHPDGRNRTTIERISELLEEQGLESFCIVRDLERWGQATFEPQELMSKTFDVIAVSDVVIVELTEKGVGVGIEAGYAAAKGIPIVTVARCGADISETLRGISRRVVLYEEFDELANFVSDLRDELWVDRI